MNKFRFYADYCWFWFKVAVGFYKPTYPTDIRNRWINWQNKQSAQKRRRSR